MHVQFSFYVSLRLVEFAAPDLAFVPDENIFSGLDRLR
jgi:hypothetical protein